MRRYDENIRIVALDLGQTCWWCSLVRVVVLRELRLVHQMASGSCRFVTIFSFPRSFKTCSGISSAHIPTCSLLVWMAAKSRIILETYVMYSSIVEKSLNLAFLSWFLSWIRAIRSGIHYSHLQYHPRLRRHRYQNRRQRTKRAKRCPTR